MLRLCLMLCLAFSTAAPAAAPDVAPIEALIQELRATVRAQGEDGTKVLVHYRTEGMAATRVHERLEAAELKRRVGLRRAALKARLLARALQPRRWLKDFEYVPVSVVQIASEAELDTLLADPDVAAVTPDFKAVSHLGESLILIGQPIVVSSGATGAGTAVVVADTGVDFTRAAFGFCTAPGVPAGCRVVHAQDFAPNDNLLDAIGHGSNVAGIVAGVATGTNIISADVFDGGTANSSDIIAAFNWAIANRATFNIVAFNLSLGIPGTYYQTACTNPFQNPFNAAINNATSAGILVVTSSGNDANVTGLPVPACSTNAVSVGAVYDANYGSRTYAACTDTTTAADMIACFSNTGHLLDLLAPGAIINAAGVSYAGTSQAAPHVAGAAAIVKAEFPGDTPAGVLTRIQNGGVLLTDTRPSPAISTRRLDLDGIFPPPANNNFTSATTLSGSSTSGAGSTRFGNKQPAEPNHAGNSGGKSVWFNWIAPANLNVNLNTTGSGFDTLLAVYTGTSVSGLTTIASNDDSAGITSALSFIATSGTTYRIAVDGKNGAFGNYNLNLSSTAVSADLAAVLSDSPDPVNQGSSTTYTLGVSNGGPNIASTVSANLVLPSAAVAGLLPSGCNPNGAAVLCTVASLNVGANSTWNIPVTLNGTGNVVATATVSSATADANAGNNTATTTTTVNPVADLSVSLSDSPDPVLASGTVSYTLTVNNAGPSTASTVSALLDLPSGFVAGVLPSGCGPSGADVLCTLASLGTGAQAVWTIPSSVAASGTLQASASVSSSTTDSNTSNNTATTTTTVTPVADLALSLSTGTPLPAAVGSPVEVNVTLNNLGPSTATTPTITLSLPPGLSLISSTGSCSGTSTLTCTTANIAAGANSGFNVTVSGSTVATLNLSASLSSTTSDPVSGNNSATLPLSFSSGAGNAVQVPALPLWAWLSLGAYVVLRRGDLRRRG